MLYRRKRVLQKMRLLISTGGRGIRLRPLTYELPKPMVPVNGKPVLEHLVEWAKANGITEIVMLNGYLHEIIERHFGDGSKFGIKIYHSNEQKPLGSGGPIKLARPFINGRFAYISGDLICDVKLSRMIESHEKAKDAIMTIFLHESSHPADSDVIKIGTKNKVIGFISKGKYTADAGNLTNAGLSIIEPRLLDLIEEEVFTFETYLYPMLLKRGEHINAYVSGEYIQDIGTKERLEKAEAYLKTR